MASIAAIDGIGDKSATKLRKAGIRTTEALLKRAATRKGREELAGATGLASEDILGWVNRADLMRIKGIGSEYADLLEAAGVETVKELRRRSSKSLSARMTELNESRRLVRRLPTEAMVSAWIEYSKRLEPTVKH
jgi:predicted flap endonuclease-1-like 5' DNA nuclease